MNTCKNKILDPDGYCGMCGETHATRSYGKRKDPVMVNGQEYKPKKPKIIKRIVNVNEARWIRAQKEKCPRCRNNVWLQIKRDEDGEEYVDKMECRSCGWKG